MRRSALAAPPPPQGGELESEISHQDWWCNPPRLCRKASPKPQKDSIPGVGGVMELCLLPTYITISSVQLLSHVWLLVTPWTAAHQASLSITNSWSLLTLMSIESVMPSSHLILCQPLLLPPSILPSIRVFSNKSVLRIRWPKYWVAASASVLPMNT